MVARLALLVVLALLGFASLQQPREGTTLAQVVTATPTATRTSTATATTTLTLAPSATNSPTAAPTTTATPTSTAIRPLHVILTFTPLPTRTPTGTATATVTRTPTATQTGTPTRTPMPSVTPTPSKPVISAIAVTNLTRSSATISWQTNLPASSQVEYSTLTSPTLSRSPIDPDFVTSHRVVLTRLDSGTSYRLHAIGTTAAGGTGVSADVTFATAAADSGPELGDVLPSRITSTTATIGWLTGTGIAAQLEYGTTASYGASTLLKVFGQPAQEMTLTGLLPRTAYHFRVKAWDGTGALGSSDDSVFVTAPSGPTTLFGDAIVYPQSVSVPGGQAAAFQYIARNSGQANALRIYLDAGSASVVRVGLYTDEAGAPGTILTQGSTSGLSAGWATVSVPPVALVQGQSYWVVVLSPLGNANVRELALGGATVSSRQSTLAALPAAWLSSIVGAPAQLAVTVQQVPPSVTLLGPAEGAIVTGKTTLSAVVDDDQPVLRVQFLVDGLPIGTPMPTPPYTVDWDTSALPSGRPHVITARANDLVGRTGNSASVTVQVDNGPVIRNVVVGRGPTASSIHLTWSTDVPSDSQVEFGPTATYGSVTPLNPRADLNHVADLTGLQPGSVYHFRVRSRDPNGALGVSVDGLFLTGAVSADAVMTP